MSALYSRRGPVLTDKPGFSVHYFKALVAAAEVKVVLMEILVLLQCYNV